MSRLGPKIALVFVLSVVLGGCASTPTPTTHTGSRNDRRAGKVATPLQQAEILIGQQKFLEARNILEGWAAKRPPNWSHRDESPQEVKIYYWDAEHMENCLINDSAKESKPVRGVIDESYSKAYYYLAYIAVELNQFPAAHAALTKGLEIEPDSGTLLAEMGTLYQSAGSPADAVKAFKSVTALHNCVPNHVMGKAYRGLGVSLIDLGELDAAEQALNTSLKYSPNNPNATGELQYLARVRAGKQVAQPLELVHPKK